MPIVSVPSLNGGQELAAHAEDRTRSKRPPAAPTTRQHGVSVLEREVQNPRVEPLEPANKQRIAVLRNLALGNRYEASTGVTVSETTNDASSVTT